MKKKMSRRGKLAAAILWTVIVGMWLINLIVRLSRPYEDQGLLVMTALTLLVSIAAAAVNWTRYINYEE